MWTGEKKAEPTVLQSVVCWVDYLAWKLAVMKDATTVSGWAHCWVVGKVCCLAKKKELGMD